MDNVPAWASMSSNQNDTTSLRVDRPRNWKASTSGRTASRSEILFGP